eukprot:TRINITY_DN338_c0_g3_i1.p1 TRINITY_DN338_c0_g3~~TRINITY_DN338_c0_g3_i1.p1  ORF type:complete len:658 (-),score=196.48 TRINITY_DN338_c0_g3_i1:197-2170(-)
MKFVVATLAVAAAILGNTVGAVSLKAANHQVSRKSIHLGSARQRQGLANATERDDIPTVVHKKEPGDGYLPGSPLYKKQQDLEKKEGKPEEEVKHKLDKEFKQAEKDEEALAVPKVDVFPVPTASRCVVIICVSYMIIFTAVGILRTYMEFANVRTMRALVALKGAAQSMSYGPMLCVLFIAARMRVEFLSGGKDQPQMWVQHCMYATTFAVVLTCLMVLLIPFVTGKPLKLKAGSCDLEKPSEEDAQGPVFLALTGTRYLIQLGLYGGIAGVIVGICTYTPPGQDDLTKLPPPAPAVMCTMILAVIFFATQLVVAGARSYTEFTGKETTNVVDVMNAAADTASFAPMLSILFLAARMRALQHDGQPQAWAQSCMYASTGALALTVLLAIGVPLALNGKMKTDATTGQTVFEVEYPGLGHTFLGLRYLTLVATYGGCFGVIASIFQFKAPAGPTNPVSPTVHCVVNLCLQYFVIYLLLNIMTTVTEVSGGRYRMEEMSLFSALNAAKATVAFAPMLSILFVTTRMYALLLTDKKGAPQAWVQDGMYMATWSLLISFVSCLCTGFAMGKVELDEDGNVVNKFENKYVAIGMTVIRYLAMLLLYGGIVTVIVGLFVMTKETANGRGSIPVVSDAVNSTPVGNPPPGPSAVSFLGLLHKM